jgi:hypothetical protein
MHAIIRFITWRPHRVEGIGRAAYRWGRRSFLASNEQSDGHWHVVAGEAFFDQRRRATVLTTSSQTAIASSLRPSAPSVPPLLTSVFATGGAALVTQEEHYV